MCVMLLLRTTAEAETTTGLRACAALHRCLLGPKKRVCLCPQYEERHVFVFSDTIRLLKHGSEILSVMFPPAGENGPYVSRAQGIIPWIFVTFLLLLRLTCTQQTFLCFLMP